MKVKREEFSNAREQMPNNTFIKLFHFLNADAGAEDGTALGGTMPGGTAAGLASDTNGVENHRSGIDGLRESGDNGGGGGPRGNKQDELQSI